MKNLVSGLAAVLCSAALCTACGNQQQQNAAGEAADSTVTTDTIVAAETVPVSKTFTLTKKGIDPILVKTNIKDVPESIEGLYTRFEKKKETFSDMDGEWTETWLEFYNEDMPMLKAWYTGGKITSVTALEGATNVCTTTGVQAGGSIAQLCELQGATWANHYDGTICITDKEFYYFISDESLTAAGNQHIETQNPKMKAADFKEDAVIRFITTRN